MSRASSDKSVCKAGIHKNSLNRESMKRTLDKELSFVEFDVEEGWEKLQKKIAETEKMDIKKCRKRRMPKVIAIAASVLLVVLLPISSAVAYNQYKRIYHTSNSEQGFLEKENLMESGVTVMESTCSRTMDNLQIEWTGQQLEDDGVILTFRLRTKDGSPLIMDEINKAPVYYPLIFESVKATINGRTKTISGTSGIHEPNNYGVNTNAEKLNYIGCTYVAEDYTYADFELSVHDGRFDMEGGEIHIQFNNLLETYLAYENLKTEGTLGDILESTPEGENLHISFSEEFPECYIDSYSFSPDSIYGNPRGLLHIMKYGKKLFTMTIVCDDMSKETIRNLAFQNTITGLDGILEMDVKEEMNGRLRFYYSVNYDGSYSMETRTDQGGEHRDTTFEDLYRLVLKLGKGRVTETVMKGTIEETIVLDGQLRE